MTTNDRTNDQWKRIIEALLFAAGEPLTPAQIAEATDELDLPAVRAILAELRGELADGERGFQLVEEAKGWRLSTNPRYSEWVQRLFTKTVSAKLSAAALEALSIVAYRQPVTRAEVDEIRGVNSDGALNTLIERKLISIAGRKDAPGRPLLYATTDEFLQHFGLNALTDLPSPEELEQMFRQTPRFAESLESDDDAA